MPAGDDRQRRLAVERRLAVDARQIERAAARRRPRTAPIRRRCAARSSRTGRDSRPASAAARATGSTCSWLCVWLITTAPGGVARSSMRRSISLHELPLRPDVHERVGAHRVAERAARERQRRVAVAADRLAARRREPAREPHLREVQVGEHRRGRRQVHRACASDDPSRRRCRSRGRPRAARAAPTARTTAWPTTNVGIGEPIQEVAAFECAAERVDDFAVGRRRRSRQRVEPLGRCRVVVEAEHRAQRQIGAARVDVLARGRRAGCRCITGMPSTTGKTQHWQPRMPSTISSPSRRWNCEVDERRAGRRSTGSGGCRACSARMDRAAASCSRTLSARTCRSARAGTARCRASARACCVVEPANGLCGAHLRPMTSQRRELRGRPSRRRRRRTSARAALIAERIRLDAPDRCRRSARRARRAARRARCITPCGIVT